MSAHLEDSSAVRVEFAPLGVTIALLLAAILVAAIVLVIWKRRRALTPAAVLLIVVVGINALSAAVAKSIVKRRG